MRKSKKSKTGTGYALMEVVDVSRGAGKILLKEVLAVPDMEVSMIALAPFSETAIPQPEKMSKNLLSGDIHREMYIVTKGSGAFHIDDKVFPVKEGSIIRVGYSEKRSMRSSEEGMTFFLFQARRIVKKRDVPRL